VRAIARSAGRTRRRASRAQCGLTARPRAVSSPPGRDGGWARGGSRRLETGFDRLSFDPRLRGDERIDVTRGRVDRRRDTSVAGSFEPVETRPVRRQVDRLEDVDLDGRTVGIENESRIAESGAPAGVHEPTVHVAPLPPASQTLVLMMIQATRREASVGRQAVKGVVRSGLTVSVAVGGPVLAAHRATLARPPSDRPPAPGPGGASYGRRSSVPCDHVETRPASPTGGADSSAGMARVQLRS